MTRRALTLWTTATALTLTVSPAWARQAKERPESRPSTGQSTGTAVSRPSGSGGSSAGSASSGGSSSSSGGGSSSSMPSGGGSPTYSREGYRAPSAPERRAERRDRAVERDQTFRSVESGRATSSSVSSGNAQGVERRAVPAYSRPRDGRQPVGEAVVRTGRIPDRGNGGFDGYYRGYYDPYYGYYNPYYGYGYGNYAYGRIFPGYGFGLGYFYDPFGYGYGYGYGSQSPYDEYGYGGYGSTYSSSYGRGRGTGQLRLKVKPEHGQVYVDGYYVGEVDNFDGVFQRMPIEAGAHRVEIRAAGFQSVTFDVMVVRGETVTYKGELRPIR